MCGNKSDHGGCSEEDIAELESRLNVRLPTPYRRFLSRFGRDDRASSVLVGSDYTFPMLSDLRSWAVQLLSESGSPFTLHPQDFVFFMHQGYQFFYFRADGANDDPPVLYYFEGRTQAEQKYNRITDCLDAFGVLLI